MNEDTKQYIRDAITNDTLEIKYQPQFSVIEGSGTRAISNPGQVLERLKISGVEALVRPDTNVCHIETLLKVAVTSNQIIDLGYHIMRKAVEQLKEWIDDNVVCNSFSMSVNVSAEQLHDKHFCANVCGIVNDAGISPHQLTIELTETSMISDVNVAKMYQLSTHGINISIDDFGTGYSSLGRLKMMPFNELKIDKMFIDDIGKSFEDVALVTAIYQLTTALDKFTIVEGVENGAQFSLLRTIGFTSFQGYYFSASETATEMTDILSLTNSLHSQ